MLHLIEIIVPYLRKKMAFLVIFFISIVKTFAFIQVFRMNKTESRASQTFNGAIARETFLGFFALLRLGSIYAPRYTRGLIPPYNTKKEALNNVLCVLLLHALFPRAFVASRKAD